MIGLLGFSDAIFRGVVLWILLPLIGFVISKYWGDKYGRSAVYGSALFLGSLLILGTLIGLLIDFSFPFNIYCPFYMLWGEIFYSFVTRKKRKNTVLYCPTHGPRPVDKKFCQEQTRTLWQCEYCNQSGELNPFKSTLEVQFFGNRLLHLQCYNPVKQIVAPCGQELISEHDYQTH